MVEVDTRGTRSLTGNETRSSVLRVGTITQKHDLKRRRVGGTGSLKGTDRGKTVSPDSSTTPTGTYRLDFIGVRVGVSVVNS